MCLKIGPLASTAMDPEFHKIDDILLVAIMGFSKGTALGP